MMNRKAQSRLGEEATPVPAAAVEWGGRHQVILVPLDGSVEAKVALPVARLTSNITGAAVHALHVAEGPLSRNELLRRLKLARRKETVGLVVNQVTGAAPKPVSNTAGGLVLG